MTQESREPLARVLPENHEFVRRVLKDFRVVEAGKRYVAKLEGEGRFQDWWGNRPGPRSVFIRFVSEREWLANRVSFLRRWLEALRLHYLSFSLLPQLLVIGLLLRERVALNIWLVAGSLAATTLLHVACNLWNDYEDHLRGVDDAASSGGSGTIQKLWIPATTIRNAAVAFFITSVAIGFYLLGKLDWDENGRLMLAIGIVGTLGAASYSGWPFHYKYLGLGEILVFFLCGPFVAWGALTVLAPASLSLPQVLFAAAPLGLQAVLRVHSGNIRRIPYDLQAGARTIANLIGFERAKTLYLGLLGALYLSLTPLAFSQAGPGVLLALLSLPVALYQYRLLQRLKGPLDPAATDLRRSSTYLDLSFGLLYTLGVIFSI